MERRERGKSKNEIPKHEDKRDKQAMDIGFQNFTNVVSTLPGLTNGTLRFVV